MFGRGNIIATRKIDSRKIVAEFCNRTTRLRLIDNGMTKYVFFAPESWTIIGSSSGFFNTKWGTLPKSSDLQNLIDLYVNKFYTRQVLFDDEMYFELYGN
jgi:hypothetical protein